MSENAKHTPGPIKVEPAGNGLDFTLTHTSPDGLRSHVCRIFGTSLCPEHGSAKANAKLFAAASEMLEALHVALPHVEAAVRNGIVSEHSVEKVRAAITKAEGRSA